jgi:putative addiction module CopG family antidote
MGVEYSGKWVPHVVTLGNVEDVMQVSLRPELAKFIEEQVKGGRFGSADDAVNEAVARLREEEELLAGELDDEDLAAIEEGLAQIERGEARPWEDVRAELVKRFRLG